MANLPDWPYWKVISITGQAGAGTDYQIELEIGDSAGGDFHLEGHCTNFPQDIRITDDDGTTLLDHWVEDLTADPIVVHVEVADDLGSNQTIRVYYGKSGETTDSNIANTMIFGDDFSSSLDWTNTWQSNDQSKYTVSSGNLEMAVPADGTKCLNSQNSFSNFIMESRCKATSNQTYMLSSASQATYDHKEEIIVSSTGDTSVWINGVVGSSGATTVNNWYRLKLSVPSSGNAGAYFYDDVGNLITSKTGTPDHTTGYINIFQWAGGTGIYDWIYVRKYNSPEPAFSSAGVEQSPGLVPVFIRHNPALTGGMV